MKLEIVYYRSSGGFVPVKKYLAKYNPLAGDKINASNKKLRTYNKIKSFIEIAAERNGIVNDEYTSSLREYDFQELKIKDGDTLIRILYFCHFGRKLVLLNGFDKPNLYEKGKKNKVDKIIKENLKEAQKYYKDFIKNPQNYEKYQ